jgi:hypothetical protein
MFGAILVQDCGTLPGKNIVFNLEVKSTSPILKQIVSNAA